MRRLTTYPPARRWDHGRRREALFDAIAWAIFALIVLVTIFVGCAVFWLIVALFGTTS